MGWKLPEDGAELRRAGERLQPLVEPPLIVSEALGIGLIALAIGLFGGWGAAVLFTEHSSLSSLAEANFTGGVFAWGLAFALGVALIGALYPAWRAISLTPIEALRRE